MIKPWMMILPAAGGSFVAASGGTETTDGDYKIHTFTTDGTFTVTAGGDVEILVVGGGASGGKGTAGVNYGAGGAGGSVEHDAAYAVTVQEYSVTIGQGGPGTGASGDGGSSIFGTITATGGLASLTSRTGGSNAHYSGGVGTSENYSSGGGAGGGQNGFGGETAYGGEGYASSISGTAKKYGGGGGGVKLNSNVYSAGGLDGGGQGDINANSLHAGTDGLGGGGGGTNPGSTNRSAGGKGVVIIRYKYK